MGFISSIWWTRRTLRYRHTTCTDATLYHTNNKSSQSINLSPPYDDFSICPIFLIIDSWNRLNVYLVQRKVVWDGLTGALKSFFGSNHPSETPLFNQLSCSVWLHKNWLNSTADLTCACWLSKLREFLETMRLIWLCRLDSLRLHYCILNLCKNPIK